MTEHVEGKKRQSKSLAPSNDANKQRERRLVEYFVVVSSLSQQERTEQQNKNHGIHFDDESDSFSNLKSEYSDDTDNELDEEYECVDEYDFQPVITSRYPLEDHEGNPLHGSITCFCHPTGSIRLSTTQSMPKVHYFVATGGKGQQVYGTCLTIYEPLVIQVRKKSSQDEDEILEKEVYLPKCLCILSNYPYMVAFREFLCQLNQLIKSNKMSIPVERYITNFCAEVPAPPPGSCEVQTTILDSVIKLWSPPHNLPIPWVSLPFLHLFQCLDLDNIVTVWHALALEHQVLFTSTQLSLLTTCSEIFVSLLFPMRWTHAYIPVLPHFLVPILSAPMPYICGIDKLNLPTALLDLSKECILVDLDKNQVTMGPMTPTLPPIPDPNKRRSLRELLESKVGMVFREARSLRKSDDYSERGIHLPSHIKERADAMWESNLCLFDLSFHRCFTPEEARKNPLNGDDASGVIGAYTKNTTKKERIESMRSQSNWDVVQEAFLGIYVHMLRNYRKFLIFPSKENEGSFGGAGFQGQKFVNSQPFAMQPFLKGLVGTQMFDDFITKRLYGSGEADVIFFDQSIVHYNKERHSNSPVGKFNRFAKTLRNENVGEKTTRPLWQSARIRQKLMTIVPPEASGADLGPPLIDDCDTDDIIISVSQQEVDCSGANNSSLGIEQQKSADEEGNELANNFKYFYKKFPSYLDPNLFGKPRPLPNAVLAEFDRQREDSGRFRTRHNYENNRNSSLNDNFRGGSPVGSIDPQVATFNVFFVLFTNIVGRELSEFCDNQKDTNRLILSSYEPVRRMPNFPVSAPFKRMNSKNDSERADFTNFLEEHNQTLENVITDLDQEIGSNDNKGVVIQMDDISNELKKDHVDSATSPTDDSTTISVLSDITDTRKENDVSQQSLTPKNRFHDSLSFLEVEEAKETARAQLGLAFELLSILRNRGLKADPESYQCLIDASGRCGDTARATQLLSWMHEDGIVADGVVYSCLVSAFSAENAWKKLTGKSTEEDLPEWANGASVEMDWNKLRRVNYFDMAKNRFQVVNNITYNSSSDLLGTSKVGLKERGNRLMKVLTDRASLQDERHDNNSSSSVITNASGDTPKGSKKKHTVTKNVMMQIMLGENLLEMIYPDISVDTDNEICPRCSMTLNDAAVVAGWTPCDNQDYTTKCPNCYRRFVPHFNVRSTSLTFLGSKGPSSPLYCERLSPWVLLKELRLVMSNRKGIENILRPEWRSEETKNATLWWNLVLSFMRYRLPFSFLLQGNFGTTLVAPTPESQLL